MKVVNTPEKQEIFHFTLACSYHTTSNYGAMELLKFPNTSPDDLGDLFEFLGVVKRFKYIFFKVICRHPFDDDRALGGLRDYGGRSGAALVAIRCIESLEGESQR